MDFEMDLNLTIKFNDIMKNIATLNKTPIYYTDTNVLQSDESEIIMRINKSIESQFLQNENSKIKRDEFIRSEILSNIEENVNIAYDYNNYIDKFYNYIIDNKLYLFAYIPITSNVNFNTFNIDGIKFDLFNINIDKQINDDNNKSIVIHNVNLQSPLKLVENDKFIIKIVKNYELASNVWYIRDDISESFSIFNQMKTIFNIAKKSLKKINENIPIYKEMIEQDITVISPIDKFKYCENKILYYNELIKFKKSQCCIENINNIDTSFIEEYDTYINDAKKFIEDNKDLELLLNDILTIKNFSISLQNRYRYCDKSKIDKIKNKIKNNIDFDIIKLESDETIPYDPTKLIVKPMNENFQCEYETMTHPYQTAKNNQNVNNILSNEMTQENYRKNNSCSIS
jgi:hypothetical protein